MSQPRLVYPLLEGFILGDAISEHDGVRCYPAIRQKSGEKYIVKVISVPASKVQLEALLLTGAFSNKDSALHYFKELASDKTDEARILQQLSQQEGFTSYRDWQIVSSQDGSGYEVYLLGTFKKSAEKIFAANDMTHRGVVELGLDLCAALAACRRAGFLYVDLKPGNIFYTEEEGYRIGDLGFASLSSLQFTPLENAYRSHYTAPEMADDFAVVNTTLDIYALGLVLYQACNGGVLPEDRNVQIPPLYADYALAQIIAKACAQNPADRWQEPTQIAQALIGYMQQVGVSDAPLIPLPLEDSPTDVEEFLPEATEEELALELALLQAEELEMEELDPVITEQSDTEAVSEDISEMLAQADDLIAHTLPEPPIVPEPIVLEIPDPIVEEEPESATEQPDTAAEPEPEPIPEPQIQETPEPEEICETESVEEQQAAPVHTEPEEPKIRRPFPWKIAIGIALAVLLVFGCVQAREYYNEVYMQNIDDLTITLEDGLIIVKVVSSVDESLLTVICTDSYGNAQKSTVTAGIAMFSDLQPKTRYNIRVQISGNHKLTGMTTGSITTAEQTEILTFTACIGDTDCSALLTLTSSGPAVEAWTLTYYADGVAPITSTFTGSHVTVYDLQEGKEYTFELSAGGQTLGGSTQIRYTATNIILAQDLAITACGGGKLEVQWSSPAGYVAVNGWAVRCYNGAGYDQTVVTYEPHFTFSGIDHSTDCTVEVMAVGMFRNVSTTIGANPVTIEKVDFSVSMDEGLVLHWQFSGNAPEGGWIVEYTMDGVSYSLATEENTVSVYSLPGASYQFTIRPAGDVPVFGGNAEFALTEVGSFGGYGLSAGSLQAVLSGSVLTLTAPEGTVLEASEDTISILCILRSDAGKLLDVVTEEAVWNAMWTENICDLTVPNVPLEPGCYILSVYFNGGWVADVTFFVE